MDIDVEPPLLELQDLVRIHGFSHDGELLEISVKLPYSGTTKRTTFKLPVFTIAEPEDGSYIAPKDDLILLGEITVGTIRYQNSFMLAHEFEKRAGFQDSEETYKTDKDAILAGTTPFDFWLYQEDSGLLRKATMQDAVPVYKMDTRGVSGWRDEWTSRLRRVSELYKAPSSRWSVSARFFKPEKLNYGIVLQPGTWGEGGRAVDPMKLQEFVNKYVPEAYVQYVTVDTDVDWNEYIAIGRHPFRFYTTYIQRQSLGRWEADLCRYGRGRVPTGQDDGIWRRHPFDNDRPSIAGISPTFVRSWDDWKTFALANTPARMFVRVLQGAGYGDDALGVVGNIPVDMLTAIKACRDLTADQRFNVENHLLYNQPLKGRGMVAMRAVVELLTKADRGTIKDLLLHDPVELSTITIGTTKKVLGSISEKRKKSQQAVMSGVSASQVARVLWRPRKEPGCRAPVVAEWLHRSAFSFGGLGFPGDWEVHDAQSSQHGKNLVFGTSEANTHMLRYESVIKDAIALTRGVYTQNKFEVDTSLMSLDDNEPYSCWYSPYLDYYYSVEWG
ncbi:hypothetical protein CERSUDRAFT_127659, partial [Gelatoporia subvermispora B]